MAQAAVVAGEEAYELGLAESTEDELNAFAEEPDEPTQEELEDLGAYFFLRAAAAGE